MRMRQGLGVKEGSQVGAERTHTVIRYKHWVMLVRVWSCL